MIDFVAYEIKVANTKTKERVVIELEFGGAEQLYQYLAPLVHRWAMGEEMKPLSTKNQSNKAILQNALDDMNKRLSQIESQIANGQIVILHKE